MRRGRRCNVTSHVGNVPRTRRAGVSVRHVIRAREGHIRHYFFRQGRNDNRRRLLRHHMVRFSVRRDRRFVFNGNGIFSHTSVIRRAMVQAVYQVRVRFRQRRGVRHNSRGHRGYGRNKRVMV